LSAVPFDTVCSLPPEVSPRLAYPFRPPSRLLPRARSTLTRFQESWELARAMRRMDGRKVSLPPRISYGRCRMVCAPVGGKGRWPLCPSRRPCLRAPFVGWSAVPSSLAPQGTERVTRAAERNYSRFGFGGSTGDGGGGTARVFTSAGQSCGGTLLTAATCGGRRGGECAGAHGQQ